MTASRGPPFATRWNHNTHYFPLLASRLPPSADSVLDVGCGEGSFCRFIRRPGRVVVGADVDSSVLLAASPGARFVVASAEALPFADTTFAAVTMSMVLHHVDARRAVPEAVRVLPPGCVLLIVGYGRYGGWRNAPHELRDVLVHAWVSRRMQAWEPPTAKADSPQTWSDVRATARQLLPGSTYRRLAMWRYLVEWRKPAEG